MDDMVVEANFVEEDVVVLGGVIHVIETGKLSRGVMLMGTYIVVLLQQVTRLLSRLLRLFAKVHDPYILWSQMDLR